MCERLDGGTILAIDRSAKTIAIAERRNRGCVEAGTATFLQTALAQADLPEAAFDVAFAVHVNLVRGGASRELAAVRRALAPAGRLTLVMHPPAARAADAFADRAADALPAAGFRVDEVRRADVAGSAAIAVTASPAP